VAGAPSITAGSPWLQTFEDPLLELAYGAPLLDLLSAFNTRAQHDGLCTGGGRPLQFIQAAMQPARIDYESWIAQTGCVPTRDNLHDRLNALIWLHAPMSKAHLNGVQAARIGAEGLARGPIRDALTLMDENLMVVAHTSGPDPRDADDWSSLFVDHQQHWLTDWHPMPFGHALLEKLKQPFKSIAAHSLIVRVAEPNWAAVDRALLDQLKHAQEQGGPRTQQLWPVPVMGIPGWSPAQVQANFYDDESVFRPMAHQAKADRARRGSLGGNLVAKASTDTMAS
jgi:hypothetical protein